MKELTSGFITILIGSLFLIKSLSYDLGSFSIPGPGMFPSLISTALILVGFKILLNGFLK